jgi:hypothetical protein
MKVEPLPRTAAGSPKAGRSSSDGQRTHDVHASIALISRYSMRSSKRSPVLNSQNTDRPDWANPTAIPHPGLESTNARHMPCPTKNIAVTLPLLCSAQHDAAGPPTAASESCTTRTRPASQPPPRAPSPVRMLAGRAREIGQPEAGGGPRASACVSRMLMPLTAGESARFV